MRRTSSMVAGVDCVEWLECTTSSDSTPSMCALEYCTTPSSARRRGPAVAHGDDRVGLDAGGERNVGERLQERIARRHVVDRRREEVAPRGDETRMPGEITRQRGEASGNPDEAAHQRRHHPACRQEAAVVGSGDEDHTSDGRQRRDEQRLAKHLARRLREALVVNGHSSHLPPDPVAAVDGHHLDDEPALAVSDQHHARQRGVLPLGVDAGHRGVEQAAEPHGGVGNGIGRIVGEEPELIAAADLVVGLEPIDHLRPAHRA